MFLYNAFLPISCPSVINIIAFIELKSGLFIKKLYFILEPKCWSRDDVNNWISYTLESHNLPVPPLHR